MTRAGFTLIELLMVVVILGITASVASMALGETGSANLEMAEIQVTTTIERAQALARSNRTAYGVVFDVGGNRFAVVDENGDIALDPLTRKPQLSGFDSPNQPKRVLVQAADFGSTGAAVVFDPQGVPVAGGTVTIGAAGTSRQISVDAATGRVTGS
jgi:type II secretion system protein H